jgi:hypothetical protein
MMARLDREKVQAEFSEAVNMAADEIERWLKSDESLAVGWKGPNRDRPESVGHASGRRIVEILRKKRDEITASDYEHMRKVVGFVRRHSAQRPENVYTSRWRYSLMNWGHDPAKEEVT